jgi:isopenicillin N synthase-like dioxygenase
LRDYQHYNFESESFAHTASQHPETTAPFIPEIEAFAKYTYHHIIRRILTLISLTLELEPDALWKLHDHRSPIGAACQRYMRYTPRDKAEEEATSGIWSKGHTDCKPCFQRYTTTSVSLTSAMVDNTVSLLFSQPVTALQILTPENDWKWVKHVPGGAVVNVADALECKFMQQKPPGVEHYLT